MTTKTCAGCDDLNARFTELENWIEKNTTGGIVRAQERKLREKRERNAAIRAMPMAEMLDALEALRPHERGPVAIDVATVGRLLDQTSGDPAQRSRVRALVPLGSLIEATFQRVEPAPLIKITIGAKVEALALPRKVITEEQAARALVAGLADAVEFSRAREVYTLRGFTFNQPGAGGFEFTMTPEAWALWMEIWPAEIAKWTERKWMTAAPLPLDEARAQARAAWLRGRAPTEADRPRLDGLLPDDESELNEDTTGGDENNEPDDESDSD